MILDELKPTWETLPFDSGIESIPKKTENCWSVNPFDESIVIYFRVPEEPSPIYYFPKTDTFYVGDRLTWSREELSKAFHAEISGVYWKGVSSDKYDEYVIYEEVHGQAFLYRIFHISFSCERNESGGYKGKVTTPRETCRYVFWMDQIYLETPEGERKIIATDDIDVTDCKDMALIGSAKSQLQLEFEFQKKVQIINKDRILEAFLHIEAPSRKMGFETFLEIYKKATRPGINEEKIPQNILFELKNRHHSNGNKLRISKDLIVIVKEFKDGYLDYIEQVRLYFDGQKTYFFRYNSVAKQWEKIPDERLIFFEDYMDMKVDGDLFAQTQMEKYASISGDKVFASKGKINIGNMILSKRFLFIEQAAKMKSPYLELLKENVSNENLTDETLSLPEVFGITGGQLKFLDDTILPWNLSHFAGYMNDAEFNEAYPDVRQRLSAVSFYISKYLNRRDVSDEDIEYGKKEACDCASTLNSLSVIEMRKRTHLLDAYFDYLTMRKTYEDYVNQSEADDPLAREVAEFDLPPKNIKPSRIYDCHRKIIRIMDLIQNREQIKKYSHIIERRKAEEANTYEWKDKAYSILMPRNAEEIIREGRELHHCVGRAGYIRKMAEGKCVILFLRKNDALDKPLLTIELCDTRICQCYGYGDSYNKSTVIKRFIETYAKEKGYTIKALIG